MENIVVIGSSSIDLVVKTDVLPQAGETVMGNSFFTTTGGKGANQAVAAARLSNKVYMIGAVGDDENGKQIIENLEQNNVDTTFMDKIENETSGTAHITLFEDDNRIIVVPAANNHVTPEKVLPKLERFGAGDIILMQHEIPEHTIKEVTDYAVKHDMKVILNPAPYRNIDKEIIDKVTWITPNESESELLFESGVDEALKAYPRKLIVTKGAAGAMFYNDSQQLVKGYKKKVVDTTGAGDTFNGALAVALIENKPLEEAVDFANLAGSFSVTGLGAQGAMPYRKELD
ncbi:MULTISPECIES: ribokinase [Staphylococcus]|uniref:Ribokinase n=1 Tax=Staphylococcus equorum TaxID=246432 RepID=A0AAP7LT59_9STAP|nr:ribokinase [Staphylococcus equorum]ANR68655.1 ribokinase [Staphylococcus equorum]ERH34356.1 ribokinase [Staphylococcus equorum UMC-CNS-924]MCE5008290.1 ribokinase [Staphylococcus equorum]MCE5048875.1 ribokinase [Staphylococcus equorum]MCM3073527.1 ribokinase [Staphylococcus equorum]